MSGTRETHRDHYPNGALLREYTFVDNRLEQEEWFIDRSQDWKKPLINRVTFDPGKLPDNVARIRKVPRSVPISYELFDADGNEVDFKGRLLPSKAASKRVLAALGKPSSLEVTLKHLEQAVALQGEEWAETRRFKKGRAVTADKLADRAKALSVAYPPSFIEFVSAHGLFSLGTTKKEVDHLAFAVWPLKEHKKALAVLAAELGCKPKPEAVAEELGLEPDVVAVLDQIILIGCEGHEDHVGFDLRTRNPTTGECSFGVVRWDDSEIEALAQEKTVPCVGRGFDVWLEAHIRGRSL